MGVVLSPKHENVEGLYANFWTWRPAVKLLRSEGVIDLEAIGPIPESFLWAEVDEEQALRIADFLDNLLQLLGSDERVLLDASITDTPDTGEFYRKKEDWHKNYSADADWLAEFRDYCRICGGFTIY